MNLLSEVFPNSIIHLTNAKVKRIIKDVASREAQALLIPSRSQVAAVTSVEAKAKKEPPYRAVFFLLFFAVI